MSSPVESRADEIPSWLVTRGCVRRMQQYRPRQYSFAERAAAIVIWLATVLVGALVLPYNDWTMGLSLVAGQVLGPWIVMRRHDARLRASGVQ